MVGTNVFRVSGNDGRVSLTADASSATKTNKTGVSNLKISLFLTLLIGIFSIGTSALAEQNRVSVSQLPQGKIVEATTYPWVVIGKLNNGVGGSCTAFMVSPKYALTAAHCLFFRKTGRYLPAESIHLILGYENQHFRRHFRISAYYIPAAYRPLSPS